MLELLTKKQQLRSEDMTKYRLSFVGALLLAGIVLLSCTNSAQNASSGTQKPPATPNAVVTEAPKQQVAVPKNLVPAPTVEAGVNGPRIAFVNQEIDYGDITFDDVVQASFEFKNVGNQPLTISNAQVQVVQGC